MARKTRIEYSGACYHVINRGNFREWIFKDDTTKEAFEICLAQAAVRSKWIVHAWVMMGNHFHLAVETPLGNLSKGMQWLQTTFSARFNAFRAEHGHIFHGRFKAILLEKGDALGKVCHYIDLNPVRAGIVPIARLESYAFGSFRRLLKPKERCDWQRLTTGLTAAGGLADTPTGRESYRQYLKWLTTEIAAGREQEYVAMSKGWAQGSEDFIEEVRQRFAGNLNDQHITPAGRQVFRETQWASALRALLRKLTKETRADDRSSAAWKAVVAWKMKSETDASNAWLAAKLGMTSSTYVSKQAGLVRDGKLAEASAILRVRFGTKG